MRRTRSRYWRRTLWLTGSLLLLWLLVTVLPVWFAVDLNHQRFLGWPLGYYMAAQGSLLVYLAIVGCYGWVMDRLERPNPAQGPDDS